MRTKHRLSSYPQITGTGHGMGRELAIKFAALGANPVLVDINEKGNAETALMVTDLTGKKAPCYRLVSNARCRALPAY